MEHPITLTEARGFLARAVLTQGPDFIYAPQGWETCWYEPHPDGSPDGGPSGKTGCLVGVALDLAGETRHRGECTDISGLAAFFPDMLTKDARIYFGYAQRSQDHGSSWGEAYRRAEDWAEANHGRA